MPFVFAIVLTLAAGCFSGLALTYYSVTRSVAFNAVKAGPWTAWPREGAPDAEPYGAAVRARNASVPMGIGEGLALSARSDDSGAPLTAGCHYRLSGKIPATRFWTITLYDSAGARLSHPLRRHNVTSAGVVREMDGDIEIHIAWEVKPGNWLSGPQSGAFTIMLRLYDTLSSATAFALDAKSLPSIKRQSCA